MQRSNEEIFLELMREETGDAALSIEHAMEMPLAKTLLRTLKRSSESEQGLSSSRKAEANVTPISAFSDPSVLLGTAIQDTFDAGELNLTEVERDALIAASDLVMIAGRRRLRLRDARRAEILEAAMGTEPYMSILQQAVADDVKQHADIVSDPIRLPSAWLRCFLSGDFSDLHNAPPSELKAALEARERLRLVKNLPANVPQVDDIARQAELAELLEPLRLLIGADGGWDGSMRRDRFVGREDELKKLRSFVDELSSKSVLEAASRFAGNVRRALSRDEKPGIMVIQARGGLGKSTLLAKFVLDHALGQERPFPFAYLDFDRAGLDPERPRQLLIEIARQVGLQFPQSLPELNRLSDGIRAEFVGSPSSTDVSYTIRDPFAAFVEIVREHATLGERAFLLVLDTMEVVQWNSSAMAALSGLLYELHAKGLDELKVVAAGRADLPELHQVRGQTVSEENIELKPLLVKETREMADALGRRAISHEWNPKWSGVIAGKREDSFRREPLAVRVAVDLIARAEPSEREKLAEEIAQSGLVHGDFIARMYFKRIVNHVRDPLAQKLAWPGLVVRRVTLEIVLDVLAPICGLRADEAENAFIALGREVWMVSVEGNALRHRQDLRARTLPLMREKDSEKFDKIARRAVAYFEKYRQRSREDYVEWIYHRLLIGEAPKEVARDLKEDLLPLLARAEEDFPPESIAANYLASRTSVSRLSPPRIRALRPNDALYHLSRTSAGVFGLDDIVLDRVALDVSKRIDQESELDPLLSGWARALRIKTGSWQRVPGSDVRRQDLSNQTLRVYLFWAARIAPTLDAEPRKRLVEECLRLCSFPPRNQEFLPAGFRSTVQMMALARIAGSETFEFFDRDLAKVTDLKPSLIPSQQAALRTAIVLGEVSRERALSLWLSNRRRGKGERIRSATISLAELEAMTRLNPAAKELLERSRNTEYESQKRFSAVEIVTAAESMLDQVLDELVERPENEKRLALAQLFACRDEDWIVPIGYAAARARPGRYSPDLYRRINSYERQTQIRSWLGRKQDMRGDMLSWMRLADEASDLAGFARQVLTECDLTQSATQELKFLLDCRDEWSRAVAKVIHSDENVPSNGSATTLSDRPPEPGPITHLDDPQKGRWGGQSVRDGREVRVVIESVERDIFYFSVIVESTDQTPLAAPVVFHLHDSFPQSTAYIRRIENQQAILKEWNAYGVFTIGVQVKNAGGQWISLEVDLANAPGLPKRFLDQ